MPALHKPTVELVMTPIWTRVFNGLTICVAVMVALNVMSHLTSSLDGSIITVLAAVPVIAPQG